MGQNNPCDQTTRNIAFDVLRILAAAAVVTIHVASDGWYDLDMYSFSWAIHHFWNIITRWAVPVFVMILGALFLDPNKQVDIRSIYSKRIPRIVIAYLFWSVVYMLYCKATLGEPKNPLPMLLHVIQGHYHMWYLYTIVGLYILIPLLRRIVADRQLMRYFFCCGFVSVF